MSKDIENRCWCSLCLVQMVGRRFVQVIADNGEIAGTLPGIEYECEYCGCKTIHTAMRRPERIFGGSHRFVNVLENIPARVESVHCQRTDCFESDVVGKRGKRPAPSQTNFTFPDESKGQNDV